MVVGGERGSILPLVAVGIVLTGVLAVGLARFGADAALRARVSAAADAAALAGAADGRDAARDVAEVNGAQLVGFTRAGAEVEVEVQIGGVTGRARAKASAAGPEPMPLPPRAPGGVAPLRSGDPDAVKPVPVDSAQ